MTLLFQELARRVEAMNNCSRSNNTEWYRHHKTTITELVKKYFPSGCGFDNGTQLDLDNSTAEKLVFTTSFHHMNDNGVYVGWTDHKIIIKPSLTTLFTLSVKGENRNQVKETITDSFLQILNTKIPIQ